MMPTLNKRSILEALTVGVVALLVVSGIHQVFDEPLPQWGYVVLIVGAMIGSLIWMLPGE